MIETHSAEEAFALGRRTGEAAKSASAPGRAGTGKQMIRRMKSQDLLEVAELERRYFSVPWSLNSLKQSLDRPEYLFFVAEKEGKAVGYGGLLRVMDEGDITNIVVDEPYRGQGLGKRLIEALLIEGRKLGLREFTLEARVSNEAAIRVYERAGFVCEGIRKCFYENPTEDALIMWKREPEQ